MSTGRDFLYPSVPEASAVHGSKILFIPDRTMTIFDGVAARGLVNGRGPPHAAGGIYHQILSWSVDNKMYF